MSFILDALKKSENERQRRVGPSLADVQVRRHSQNRPWWAFALGGLLLINVGVLALVLTRDKSPDPAAPAPASAAAPSPAASAPPPRTASAASRTVAAQPGPSPALQQPTPPEPEVRSLADEARAADAAVDPPYSPHLNAAANVPERSSVVQPLPTAAAPPAARPVQEHSSGEVLPSYHELRAGGAELPELHVDIHVHSQTPAERFVFINMRKYVEGQTLGEGPALERITPEGVVLNQRGLRFLLPRQ